VSSASSTTPTEPTVLHVLPHPGGGGETYVNLVSRMPGYRFERLYLAPGREPLASAPSLARSVPRVNLGRRGFDLLHVHGEMASLLCLPALARSPSIVNLHGLSFARRSRGIARKIAEANLRLLVRAAARTICASQEEHDEALGIVGAGLAGKLTLLRYGVDIPDAVSEDDRSALRSELGVGDATLAVTVGVLEYPKDPLPPAQAAIEVARSGQPMVLLIVGDGRLRPELEEIARVSDGAVRLLGHRSDVPTLLAAADAFVLSSKHEGLPFALLEALAAGLPAIVSKYPGAEDAVADAGIVVPFGDIDGFAQAYRRLAADPAARAELGRLARERAATHYSLQGMLDQTRQLYDEALGR
jgi:glycosyltransferase involved in cell wall biosynthesis